jgi:hypothetical protein
MSRFAIQDLHTVERTPTSPSALRFKLGEMILSSSNVHAKVEALNPDTGEYRIVLQGTLGTEPGKFSEP